jgi:hypothetical protein
MLFDDDEPFDLSGESVPDDPLPDMWVAHERPDRPLARGAWLCDCGVCLRTLAVAAAANPHLSIVIKTSADRIIVSAPRALREWQEGGSLEGLLLLSYDFIREVFVGDAPTDQWDGEFWSLYQSLSRKNRRVRRGSRADR